MGKETFQYATWTRLLLACAAGYSAEVSGHRATRKGGWEAESQVAAESSEEGTFSLPFTTHQISIPYCTNHTRAELTGFYFQVRMRPARELMTP